MPKNKSAVLRYKIIDNCLRNTRRKYPSLEFIQEKIEDQLGEPISISMLNKDLAEMRTIYGAPIMYSKANKGYHYSEEDFSLQEFPLTEAEIEALDFSTALLQQLKGTALFEQFENAINKLIEGFRISKVIGTSESNLLQVEEPLKHSEQPWLEILLKAITEKQLLSITYQVFGKEPKLHAFSPYLLKEFRNRWYVIGHSDRAKHILVMALDRIQHIEKAKGKYIADNDFKPADFFRYSFGITQITGAKPEKVVLSFTKDQANYVHSQPLHRSQYVVKETNIRVDFGYEVYITHELIMTILSYGPHVKVLQPASLKKQIIDQIKEMNQLYAQNK